MCRDYPRARGNRSFVSAGLQAAAYTAFALLWLAPPCGFARDADREYSLKAGYLFNFIQFVEWPAPGGTDPFTICFRGSDGVLEQLSAALPAKRMGSRPVAARTLSPGESLAGCHVLYLDGTQLASSVQAISARAPGLLTVSDGTNFLSEGGIIELFAEGNRLRFRISLDNARRANLRISSSLLQLASSVERSPES
jgi:hypothetical protein